VSNPDTHVILRDAIQKVGVKRIASALEVSQSLVYKWCQPHKDGEMPDSSGVTNPLDRLMLVYELTQDLEIVQYICRQAGGYYTPNPPAEGAVGKRFVSETVQILDKFADLMRYAEQSLHNDGRIDPEEGKKLRKDWDRLKSRLESFVRSCEDGHFDLNKDERGVTKP